VSYVCVCAWVCICVHVCVCDEMCVCVICVYVMCECVCVWCGRHVSVECAMCGVMRCAHVSVWLACKCNVCDVYEVIGGDLCVCVCDVYHVSVPSTMLLIIFMLGVEILDFVFLWAEVSLVTSTSPPHPHSHSPYTHAWQSCKCRTDRVERG